MYTPFSLSTLTTELRTKRSACRAPFAHLALVLLVMVIGLLPQGSQAQKIILPYTSPVAGPALVAVGGRMILAWREPSGYLDVISSSDGFKTSDSYEHLSFVGYAWSGPALAFYKGRLYIAWLDTSYHVNVMASESNGVLFGTSGWVSVSAALSSAAPALAASNGSLYLAWEDRQTTELHIASSLGYNPAGRELISFGNEQTLREKTYAQPALAVYNGNLYLAWTGTDYYNHLNITRSANGISFPPGNKVMLNDTSPAWAGPSLAVANGRLYLAWTGTDWYSHLNVASSVDGVNFPPYWREELGELSANSPSLTFFTYGPYVIPYIAWTGVDGAWHLNIMAFWLP